MILISALALMAAAPNARQPTDPKAIDPGSWVSEDDYPPAARRDNVEGRTSVALMVDAAGRVVSCRVDVSSGSTVLDETTCKIVLERGKFAPARDRRGKAVAGALKFRMNWKLSGEDSPNPNQFDPLPYRGRVVQTVSFADDGTRQSCTEAAEGANPPVVKKLTCDLWADRGAVVRAVGESAAKVRRIVVTVEALWDDDQPAAAPAGYEISKILSTSAVEVTSDGALKNCVARLAKPGADLIDWPCPYPAPKADTPSQAPRPLRRHMWTVTIWASARP